jgi:hypothetical protein
VVHRHLRADVRCAGDRRRRVCFCSRTAERTNAGTVATGECTVRCATPRGAPTPPIPRFSGMLLSARSRHGSGCDTRRSRPCLALPRSPATTLVSARVPPRGGVDCWGQGEYGQLGDGQFYTSGNEGSAVPVHVEGVGGTGTLASVAGLTSDTAAFCTVMTSGSAVCWGNGYYGQLGKAIGLDSRARWCRRCCCVAADTWKSNGLRSRQRPGGRYH